MKKIFVAAIAACAAFVSAVWVLNTVTVVNIAILLMSVACLSALLPRIILSKDNFIGGYLLEMVIGIGWFSSVLITRGITIYSLVSGQAAIDFDAVMLISAATLMLVGISGFFWQAVNAPVETKVVSTQTKLEKFTMQKNKYA